MLRCPCNLPTEWYGFTVDLIAVSDIMNIWTLLNFIYWNKLRPCKKLSPEINMLPEEIMYDLIYANPYVWEVKHH